jgi:sugar/nucleoside kinase (ribokinase family)
LSIGGRRRQTLVIVGAATRDIDDRSASGWSLGGGVTFGALAAARLGLHVRALVGVDALAATAPELDLLRAEGVELRLARLRRGPVMENRELATGRLQLVSQPSDRLPPSALPSEWRSPDGVLLAPIANELGAAWAGAFDERALVGLAWQGLFRRLLPGQPMVHRPLRRRALIDRADVGLVSADDAAAGGEKLTRLLRRDGQQLVISYAERGGLHVERRAGRYRLRLLPAVPAAAVTDATGAGDVFLATWFGGLLVAPRLIQDGQGWRALGLAATAASVSVEATRLEGPPSLRAICERLLRQLPDEDDGR